MHSPSDVLVPLVGHPGEEQALEYALEQFPDASITVLAVVLPLGERLSEGGILDREEEREVAERERAARLLEAAGERAESVERTRSGSDGAGSDSERTDLPSRVDIVVETGRPGTVVPAFASEHDIDHVVMSGDDGNWLTRRLLGRDITTTVTNRAPVPVTVVE
ncbi:universal stress protein [Halobacteria archaeon AArc-curdl1]|uniref:Universal stress protein n=1 Tax=Natronosalvus hydrolyticus TaxID=2979988 RepID=A0AAP3E6E4_9EURY|nr:universal stress protein [Halobacteria archaeon AArc-curdl1]